MGCVSGLRSRGLALVVVAALMQLSAPRAVALPRGAAESPQKVLTNAVAADTVLLWQELVDAQKDEDPERQLVFYSSRLRLSRELQWTRGVISCLYNMGLAYKNSGAYAQSLDAFRDALRESYMQRSYYAELPRIYNGIGSVFLVQGQMERALRSFHQGLAYLQHDTASAAAGSLYNNLAGVLTRMKHYRQALVYLEKAAELAERHRNDKLLGNILANKGSVFFLQHDYPRALFYFENLLKLSREISSAKMEHHSLYNLGMVYMAREMPDKALYYLQKAQEIPGYINPYNATALDLAVGKASFLLNDLSRAEHILKGVAARAAQLELSNEMISSHDVLSRLYAGRGDYYRAFLHKDTFHFLEDKYASRQMLSNIDHLEARFRTVQKDKEIAQQQLVLNRQERDLERNRLWLVAAFAGSLVLTLALLGIRRMYRQRQKIQAGQIQMLQRDQEIFRRDREISDLRAIMQGEEKERARIARELHDGIVSTLSATRLHFSTLVSRMEDTVHSEEFREILDQLAEATQELRVTAQNLTPEILLQNGLLDAVDHFCRKMSKVSGIEIDFEVMGKYPVVSGEFELSLYRMIQELIHNVLKHAQASGMIIQLSCRNDRLYLSVEDNGTGMPAGGQGHSGTGLKNIEARMKVLNGRMHIDSDKNGTAVYLEFDIYYVKKIDLPC